MRPKIKIEAIKLRSDLVRLAWIHFAYGGVLIAQIILYDTSKLITPELVLDRWIMTAGLLAVTTFVWYMARTKTNDIHLYHWLVLALISIDIAVATLSVYTQRGMASRAVFLFVIPIIVAAALKSRAALFATAAACAAIYSTTCIKYFVDYFNEGYKVELYGEVGFYSALFLILAGLLSAVFHTKQKT